MQLWHVHAVDYLFRVRKLPSAWPARGGGVRTHSVSIEMVWRKLEVHRFQSLWALYLSGVDCDHEQGVTVILNQMQKSTVGRHCVHSLVWT